MFALKGFWSKVTAIKGYQRALLAVAFSVAMTDLFLKMIGLFQNVDVSASGYAAGSVCAMLISMPVSMLLVRRGAKIENLHRDLTAAYVDLERRAGTDQLTGLINRDTFFKTVDPSVAPGWIILGDVDYFKQINDNHGHAVGDRVLASIGEVIHSSIHDGAYCARIGGEEFAIYIPEATQEEAAIMAESLRWAIGSISINTTGGDIVRPTMSIGVASLENGTLSELLQLADAAMYEAKRGGRDRVVFAPMKHSADNA